MYLSGISLVFAILIALPLGIFQAVRRNSLGDNAATSAAFILYSMPSFFLGLILIRSSRSRSPSWASRRASPPRSGP